MELYKELETLYDKYVINAQTIIQEDIAEREIDLKEKLIDLLDNDFENKFVKKLRLDLNDFIDIYFLVAYAQIKLNELGHMRPDLVLQALMAKNLATKAKELRERIDSIDRDNIEWTTIDVYQVRQQEKMVNNYIAQASAIFHGLDNVIISSSKNKAGKIIKRRIRRTKRRNINSRNSRNSRKYRKYRNSTRRTQ
jgi:nitrate reductase cytochrome c-type subunit